jgi:hypothetical protein
MGYAFQYCPSSFDSFSTLPTFLGISNMTVSKERYGIFQVLTGASMKMTALWDTAP